ncbi:hypothetical protein [Montanilutibacter psychrotolerans]|uniref:hypothetical protein n=1 Tax=Montanilutibacter psychrotolerans TaxID=1327343 RepID=UPI0011CD8C5D|nr:hypothetical protein [Lysobacter psychrotolerans]
MSWMNALVAAVLAVGLSACHRGAGELPYPPSQRQFVDLNRGCLASYDAGANEIQKSLAFNACNKSRTEFAANGPIRGWLGTVESISTDQGADVVSFRIATSIDGFDIAYRTVNNRVSDDGYGSLITQDSPLFGALANLRVGEVVAFDGEFLDDPSDERRVWESSITERGSMEEPGFNLRFTSVRATQDELASPAPQVGLLSDESHSSRIKLPPARADSPTVAGNAQREDGASGRTEVDKPYSSRRVDLLKRGYQPQPAINNVLPHTLGGDPAACGNAGCQVPWTKGDEVVCVSVEVNDDLEEAGWLSHAASGPCTY